MGKLRTKTQRLQLMIIFTKEDDTACVHLQERGSSMKPASVSTTNTQDGQEIRTTPLAARTEYFTAGRIDGVSHQNKKKQ